jgi:SAM-dependent methyltransferase
VGVLAFSDPIDDPASVNPPDEYIMPVSGSSRFVDDLAVRERCELAVDLGCGQGFLALRALTHAQRCIATDINPRALAFARTNASLGGGSERIDTRQGSFFEPLADVMGGVDLLTCNPPFVIQPGAHTTASVSPTEGDGMLEHLVRTIPRVLREGGWGTLIGIWEHASLPDWVSRVRGWVEGCGCDVLALQFRTYRPEEYLQQWFPPEVAAESEPGWRELCERRKIGGVTYGGIVMRKRAGANWLRSLFTLINVRTGGASEQLRGYFRTQTALHAGGGPESILNHRVRVAPGWRFDPAQPVRAAPAGASIGLALPLQQASQHEPLLRAFTGTGTARETLAQLRQGGRIPLAPEHPAVVELVNSLAAQGCLEIAD